MTRQDLLVYLRDWIDDNEQTSSLAASFPAGTCVMLTPGNRSPFEDGFGDENQPYQKGENRYKAKNARMDSLDELYLVAGVDDAFMAAFGDALTVYLPVEAKRNVNELEPERLLELAKLMADPPGQPALYDLEFPKRLQALVAQQTVGGMLAITPADLGRLVEQAGVTVNMASLAPTSPGNPFTDRSSVFRVRAQGKAGMVTKTLDAVVRFDKGQASQDPAPGRLVHWQEE
jgi:general secretion pathway protein K